MRHNNKVIKDMRELQVHKVYKGLLELQGLEDFKEHKGLLDFKEHKDLRDSGCDDDEDDDDDLDAGDEKKVD